LTISAEDAAVQRNNPRSDVAFQRLLLKFSDAAAQGTQSQELILLFCRATREFFQVDGAYFWQRVSADEFVGAEADGVMADRFRGTRVNASQGSVAIATEAIRQQKTVYENRLDPGRYLMAAEYRARSIMAAPLVVSHDAIGAAVFLHCSDPDFFTPDLAAKATILAGQLGSLLEASRLTQVSREEHRRTKILAEVAQAIHSAPQSAAVVEAVADRLRVLLRTRLVCMMVREGAGFGLNAVAAESSQLAASVRARHDRRGLQFAADLASRAVAAGEPISVAIDPATHALGELVPPGMLIAAPFRTSLTQGAVLIYPRQEGVFSAEEKSLISVVTGFAAVAIANAELYNTARARAYELHQLLDISAELGSIGQLDEFLQQFALRAADFLGFGRGFIGLLENGSFHVRWAAENGQKKQVDFLLPSGPASQALLKKEVFWSDQPSKVPGANQEILTTFDVKQLLTVPLLDTEGEVLGMFGVLDRIDQAGISQEEIRRARALAAQVAVALEVTRNLHQSEQHRRRAESLMGLALELNGHLRLPDFARRFVGRAADILGAHQAALAVKQESGMETLVLRGADDREIEDRSLLRRFSHAMEEALARHEGAIVSSSATELFGAPLALNWGKATPPWCGCWARPEN
jgi:GAF domain-containing protein